MVNKTFEFQEQQNSVDLLYDDEDIMIASIDLFHVDNEGEHNRNMCNISRECAEKSLKTFFNKPLILRFNSVSKDFVTDVTEHAHSEKELFETRIAGHIPSDSRITFIERDNGKTYCNAEAVIQKKYMPQFVEILKRENGKMKVSIEIEAKGREDKDGVFIIEKFKLQSACVLGEKILEGIEGSCLNVLKFSQNDLNLMNSRYLAFSMANNRKKDIFDEIKEKTKETDTLTINNSLSLGDIASKISSIIEQPTNEPVENWVQEIYPEEKVIIIRDVYTNNYYRLNYIIDNDEIIVDFTSKEQVVKDWHSKPEIDQQSSVVFAKDDFGVGETIKVDKSKDAVSYKEWGDVDKTELRHKVLNAKNYKTLVYDVYAEVEKGWEDAPSSKLKYPIMLIEGDTAVYSRYGLASALGYAKAENNNSVVTKIQEIYDAINIEEKEEKMDGEKELQNKIDADNPEIEKIKDDADAIEDDKKEELRNAEVDAPEEEKLKDDIDSDKDYWEKKYSELETSFKELETKYAACTEELSTYKQKEDKEAMMAYLNSFKKCFSEEELSVMAQKIENAQRNEFEKEVDDKVKEFARKMSLVEETEEKKEVTNSFSVMVSPTPEEGQNENKTMNIDDLYAKYSK